MNAEHMMPNGDVYILRECEDEDGCVVLEKWMSRPPPDELDKAFDAVARAICGQPPAHPEGEVEQELDDDFHVPLTTLMALIAEAQEKPQ